MGFGRGILLWLLGIPAAHHPCCSPCFGVEGCRGLLALALIGVRQVSRALSHLPQYLGRRFGVAPKDEAEHLIKRLACGRWIDYRNLLEVFEHAGPLPHPAENKSE